MSNMKFIGILTLFYVLVSETALSLGITTTKLAYPDGLNDMGDTNIFEILLRLPIWALNMFSSIFQLAFFTTELPVIISSIVYTPILFMLVYLGIVTVRGGAN